MRRVEKSIFKFSITLKMHYTTLQKAKILLRSLNKIRLIIKINVSEFKFLFILLISILILNEI